VISELQSHKHLGLFLSNDCSWWDNHFKYIKDKAWQRLNIMRSLKFKLDKKALECIYTSFIRPLLEYGDIIFDSCTQRLKDELESLQLEAARIVTGATNLISHNKLYQEIGWLPLAKRRYIHKLILFYKMINGLTPNYLLSIVPSRNPGPQPNTRTRDNLPMLLCKTTLYYNSFFPSCIRSLE